MPRRRLRERALVLGEPADTFEPALASAAGVPGPEAARLPVAAAGAEVLGQVRADRAEARRPAALPVAGRAIVCGAG